jgi:hypothetical protein
MTKVVYVEGGPFVIGRRLLETDDWEMLDRGFTTRDDALAYIKANVPENYDWSIISVDELNAIDRRTITGASH